MTVTWNTKVYARERSILKVSGIASATNYVHLKCGTFEANYYGNSLGVMEVDLTDLIRTANNGTFFLQEKTAAGGNVGVQSTCIWGVASDVNPARLVIPKTDDLLSAFANSGEVNIIMPSRAIESIPQSSSIFELTNYYGAYHNAEVDGQSVLGKQVFLDLVAGSVIKERAVTDEWTELGLGDFDINSISRHAYIEEALPGLNIENCARSVMTVQYGQSDDILLYGSDYVGAGKHVVVDFVGEAGEFKIVICGGLDCGDFEVELFDTEEQYIVAGRKFALEFDLRFVPGEQEDNEWYFEDIRIYPRASYDVTKTTVEPMECGRQYAVVQWKGRLGSYKRGTWEVVKHGEATEKTTEFERIDNAYDVRKSYIQTMTLRLSNLTAYDYWYYSDIVTSSDVRVALADWNDAAGEIVYGSPQERCRVEVITKNITVPNGDTEAPYKLEVQVNFRRYDED